MDASIIKAVECLARARNAVALTGAGISTESGIPDFRSPGGLWERIDPGEFSIDRFLQNPARFWRLHRELKASGDFDLASASPNPAHDALARMESEAYDVVITDLKMGALGGMEVLNRIKTAFHERGMFLFE